LYVFFAAKEGAVCLQVLEPVKVLCEGVGDC